MAFGINSLGYHKGDDRLDVTCLEIDFCYVRAVRRNSGQAPAVMQHTVCEVTFGFFCDNSKGPKWSQIAVAPAGRLVSCHVAATKCCQFKGPLWDK